MTRYTPEVTQLEEAVWSAILLARMNRAHEIANRLAIALAIEMIRQGRTI